MGLIFALMIVAVFLYWPKPQVWPAPPDKNWTMLAVGDVMLSREVSVKINQNGLDFPFANIKDVTNSTNLTVGNLESPFTSGKSITDQNSMIFGAELKSITGLKNAGFDALNLANNHFFNQGQEGMNLTFNILNTNSIGYFGAGADFNSAHQPLIKKVKDIKIAFLGYSDKDVLPANATATTATPGVAVAGLEQVKIDIAGAKTKADVIIVSMHSGYEYTPYANQRQIEFAHAAVDAGADIIIGHHPHVVQAIEDYKGKKIFYSLGNFVFDQPWSTETKQGLMVKFYFDGKNLTKTDLIPIKIENWVQPRVLLSSEPEYQTILNRIQMASEKL